MLLNNAHLNYCLPEAQVLVCSARCKRTEVAAKEKEAEECSHFKISCMKKVALLNVERSKCAELHGTSAGVDEESARECVCGGASGF